MLAHPIRSDRPSLTLPFGHALGHRPPPRPTARFVREPERRAIPGGPSRWVTPVVGIGSALSQRAW